MVLDDIVNTLLAPARWADELLLRAYTKAGDLVEDKTGMPRLGLTLGIEGAVVADAVSQLVFYTGRYGFVNTLTAAGVVFATQPGSFFYKAYSQLLQAAFAVDFYHSFEKFFQKILPKEFHPLMDAGYRSFRKLRLPLAVAAAATFVYDHPLVCFESAVLSSSMYLKSNDDDLLRKDPLWSRAYHALFGGKPARQEARYEG